jgi:c-di-GMP-binding flagellar brake protein YcgR
MPHNHPHGAERRRYERFTFRKKVKIQFFEDDALEFSAVDISAGGLGVNSRFNYPADLACTIQITIPFTDGILSFEAKAMVKHTIFRREEDGFILGLSFKQMEPSLQTAIVCIMRGKKENQEAAAELISRLGVSLTD